jgi:hypothetical protein
MNPACAYSWFPHKQTITISEKKTSEIFQGIPENLWGIGEISEVYALN